MFHDVCPRGQQLRGTMRTAFGRRRIRFGLAVATALAAFTLPVSTAQAASGFSITPPGTIQGEDCYDAAVTYAVAPDPAVASWTIDLSIYHPDGSYEGGDFLSSGSNLPNGTSAELLCGDLDPYGRYTVQATLETHDASDNLLQSIPTATSFAFIPPAKSTTHMTVSSGNVYPGHPITVKVRVTRQGKPWAHVKVRLEVGYGGVWATKALAKKTTNARGRLMWTLTPKNNFYGSGLVGHTYRFRAVTTGTRYTAGDQSPSRKVHFGR